jgi:hypothetical protein
MILFTYSGVDDLSMKYKGFTYQLDAVRTYKKCFGRKHSPGNRPFKGALHAQTLLELMVYMVRFRTS